MVQFNIDLVSIIIGLALILGLFIAILIMTVKKENKLPNIILGFFLLAVSLTLSGAVIYSTNTHLKLPYLIRLNEPFRFLPAPLFYFYAISLINGKIKWKSIVLLHLLLFIMNTAYLLPFYFRPDYEKIRFVTEYFITPKFSYLPGNLFFLIMLFLQFGFYTCLVKKEVGRFETIIENNYSTIDRINLLWLNYFANSALLFCGFLPVAVISRFIGIDFGVLSRPVPFVVSIFLLFLVFKAMRQPQIIADITLSGIEDRSDKKYEASKLSERDALNYLAKLNAYMDKEKPYLEPGLTLRQLSEALDIPYRHLSQVINEKTGFNFYNYINSYRIDEVKKYLSDADLGKESILDLAFDAGFNSKAAFNAVFKQFTGSTPGQFRRRQ